METRRDEFTRATGGQIERRTFAVELRASGDDAAKLITGHGAVFNQEAEIWDGIYEVVRSGAFAKTIQEADVRALFNHDPNFVLGRNKAGTLRLSEDETGLRYDIDPPDTTWANDLYTSIKRGDITQSSYAFLPVKETWTARPDGSELRELLEVRLFDVSPVTYPAFEGADVSARALEAFGIDADGLARLSVKQQRGTPLTASERAMLKAAIDRMSVMLATPEPGQRSHSEGQSDDDKAGALKLRRQRLAFVLAN